MDGYECCFSFHCRCKLLLLKTTRTIRNFEKTERDILGHGNISAYFRDERYNCPRIWSNRISSWPVKCCLRLTLLTWTALMCPVGALDASEVWLGKIPCFPPLLLLKDTQRVFNMSWQENFKLKWWQNQCSYTCSESPPGDLHTFFFYIVMTEWLRKTNLQLTSCLAWLICSGDRLQVCIKTPCHGRLLLVPFKTWFMTI